MQKLTIFSVLLTLSILLIIGDLVVHDYLNPQTNVLGPSLEQTTANPSSNPSVELQGDEFGTPLEEPVLPPPVVVEVDTVDTETLTTTVLRQDLFDYAGFLNPTLKESLYSGYVFQFVSFMDHSEADIYEWNLFTGEEYVGRLYEMQFPTSTESFQAYMDLRSRSAERTDLGTVNETNSYGGASFYFNHADQTKTVHMVMRSDTRLYAFQYAYSYHEFMKKVFDLL